RLAGHCIAKLIVSSSGEQLCATDGWRGIRRAGHNGSKRLSNGDTGGRGRCLAGVVRDRDQEIVSSSRRKCRRDAVGRIVVVVGEIHGAGCASAETPCVG